MSPHVVSVQIMWSGLVWMMLCLDVCLASGFNYICMCVCVRICVCVRVLFHILADEPNRQSLTIETIKQYPRTNRVCRRPTIKHTCGLQCSVIECDLQKQIVVQSCCLSPYKLYCSNSYLFALTTNASAFY